MAKISVPGGWTVSDANLVPDGGSSDQVLTKTTPNTGDYQWADPVTPPPGSMEGMWRWSAAPTTAVPGTGQVGVNKDDPRVATLLTIATVDMSGNDRTAMFAGIDPDDTITFTTVGQTTSWHRYRVTQAVATVNGGYQMTVVTAAGSIAGTEPPSGTELVVVVDRVGTSTPGPQVSDIWVWLAPATFATVGATRIGVNTDDPAQATECWIHKESKTVNIDYSATISALTAGNHLYLQMKSNHASYHRYTVTGAPTLQGGTTWKIPVTTDTSTNTEPASGADLLVIFQF